MQPWITGYYPGADWWKTPAAWHGERYPTVAYGLAGILGVRFDGNDVLLLDPAKVEWFWLGDDIIVIGAAGPDMPTSPVSTTPAVPTTLAPLSTLYTTTEPRTGGPTTTSRLTTTPLSTTPLSTTPLSTLPETTTPEPGPDPCCDEDDEICDIGGSGALPAPCNPVDCYDEYECWLEETAIECEGGPMVWYRFGYSNCTER